MFYYQITISNLDTNVYKIMVQKPKDEKVELNSRMNWERCGGKMIITYFKVLW